MRSLCLFLLFSVSLSSCVIKRHNIVYDENTKTALDVYVPRWKKSKGVLVFAYGGNWEKGSKRIYRFFGKGMARKGISTVIFNYRLYPDTNYLGMSGDAARAVAWTYKNISGYRSDPEKIVVAGHSAGAQLVGVIALDDAHMLPLLGKNPVKGLILIDPFGLDVYGGLSAGKGERRELYTGVFTNDTAIWKQASPYYHIRSGMPPVIIFVGGDTYHGIRDGAQAFYKKLLGYQPSAKLITVPGKKHSPMIFMFLNPFQKSYRDILHFLENIEKSG